MTHEQRPSSTMTVQPCTWGRAEEEPVRTCFSASVLTKSGDTTRTIDARTGEPE